MPVSRLTAVATPTGSSLASGGTATSSLGVVEQLQTELGAKQTARGTLVALPGDVLFDFDKATIRPDARPQLDKLAELIKAQAPPSTVIEGHTDTKGDDAYNQRLSDARAVAVRDYLIGVRTVDGTKLTTKGLGELRPVAPNATAEGGDDETGRQKNRRGEVILAR